MRMPIRKGFTLIELLIVVAIIAILAAIAVPNFLEAQTRSKISRVKSDMRTLATGLTAYNTDTNDWPPNMMSYSDVDFNPGGYPFGLGTIDYRRGRTVAACCWRLTTPVAYLTSIDSIRSPFWKYGQYADWVLTNNGPTDSWVYVGSTYWFAAAKPGNRLWTKTTMMPANPTWESSGMLNKHHQWYCYDPGPDQAFAEPNQDPQPYDPTNGTISRGDIYRCGP